MLRNMPRGSATTISQNDLRPRVLYEIYLKKRKQNMESVQLLLALTQNEGNVQEGCALNSRLSGRAIGYLISLEAPTTS